MTKWSVLYYDDVTREAEGVSRALERACSDLCVRVVPPPQALGAVSEQVKNVDLLVVDYALTEPPEGGVPAGYYGSTLVAHLKSQIDDRPVVIITKTSVLKGLTPDQRRRLEEGLACDDLLVKADVLNKETTNTVAARLRSLAHGFRALRSATPLSWDKTLALLKASGQADEADRLILAAPPLDAKEMTVAATASWLRRVVMGYPGILYDDLHAATNLGISTESFRNPDLQALLQSARYTGIFATDELHRYWWKGRLRSTAIGILLDAGYRGGIIPGFAEVLRTKHGIEVTPSRCNWDRSAYADQVCYLLNQPMKLEHSLAYAADNRPAVMDECRVSFRALRESDDLQVELLDPIGRDLVAAIRALDEPELPSRDGV